MSCLLVFTLNAAAKFSHKAHLRSFCGCYTLQFGAQCFFLPERTWMAYDALNVPNWNRLMDFLCWLLENSSLHGLFE